MTKDERLIDSAKLHVIIDIHFTNDELSEIECDMPTLKKSLPILEFMLKRCLLEDTDLNEDKGDTIKFNTRIEGVRFRGSKEYVKIKSK